MTDQQPQTPEIINPEVVDRVAGGMAGAADDESPMTVSEPAKVMRIGTMVKQLLEEVRITQLDERGRDRLREIYEISVEELAGALSSDLEAELLRLAIPFDADAGVPSESELRVAQAQLVGWLEGLFHGIQATLFAQQTAARQQLDMMQRSQALPSGQGPGGAQQGGVYL
jgi:hypothetical protein